MDLSKGYQSEKFQCRKLSGSSFTEEFQKYNDYVIFTSLHIFGIGNFHILGNLLISYQSANFRVLQLSESNFIEVSIRHPKTPLWRHYDVTSQYLVCNIAHFVEISRSYQPAKCYWPELSGSNFMTSDLHDLKKHSPYGVKKTEID